jgi:hypothetical protein
MTFLLPLRMSDGLASVPIFKDLSGSIARLRLLRSSYLDPFSPSRGGKPHPQ